MDYTDQTDPQFNKCHFFQHAKDWKLPKTAYKSPPFHIDALHQIKGQLNRVKGQLDQFDLAQWTAYTYNRDLAGYITSQLRKKIKPELLTQAWCKFYEILSKFPLVEPHLKTPFKSLHLCEAPGAFICALNHYLALHCPCVDWTWYANTLNPFYEGNSGAQMIPDDRLICHTSQHWLFGADLTGNILTWENYKDIVQRSPEVNLVTADGSINCMADPGEQEKLVEFLHYCEAVTALKVIRPGGCFVLKIFTIFEHSTVCLVFLLNCVFEQVAVFKPSTSKSGNSELYLVCLGYKGVATLAPIWEQLVVPYKTGGFSDGAALWDIGELPKEFLDQIVQCCNSFFLDKQCAAINGNIRYFLATSEEEEYSIHKRKIDVANRYIRICHLAPISKQLRLVPYLNVHAKPKQDSFTNTVCLSSFNFKQYMNITLGKRIETVYNSKFWDSSKCTSMKLCINDTRSLYNLSTDKLHRHYTIISGANLDLNPYYDYQKQLFSYIKKSLTTNKHIICLNVPIHTHFLASLWCILATAFEYVHVRRGVCVFTGPSVQKVQLVNEALELIEKSFTKDCLRDIVYILRPEVFCDELSFVCPILRCYNDFNLTSK